MRPLLSNPWVAPAVLATAVLVAASDPTPDPAKPTDPKRVADLIKKLGHEEFAEREAAQQELEVAGEPALPQLRGAATNESPEIRDRAYRTVRMIVWGTRTSKSTGLVTVPITPGPFNMGTSRLVGRRGPLRPDEAEHIVRISRTFLIGTHEVTQDEYAKVMKATPSWFAAGGGGKDKVKGQDTGAYPVERVSWFDAVAFCNQLSGMDGYPPYYKLAGAKRAGGAITEATVTVAGGNGYRLPTEAEWEYACRAGTATQYHFGTVRTGKEGNFKTIASGGYGGPDAEVYLERTAKVGSYPPNAWGLCDMHGNVAEWCGDWYDAEYYKQSPEADPTGPDDGRHRTCRGGSWLVSYQSCRSSTRNSAVPGEASEQTGFRVARTP